MSSAATRPTIGRERPHSWGEAVTRLPGLQRLFTGPHGTHFLEPEPDERRRLRLVGFRSNVVVAGYADLLEAEQCLDIDQWWVECAGELVPFVQASTVSPRADTRLRIDLDAVPRLPGVDDARTMRSLLMSVEELRRDLRWHLSRVAPLRRLPSPTAVLGWLDGRRQDDPVLARSDRELQLAALLALRDDPEVEEPGRDADAPAVWLPAGRVTVRLDPPRGLCSVLLDGSVVIERSVARLPGGEVGVAVREARVTWSSPDRACLEIVVAGCDVRWASPADAMCRATAAASA